MIKVSNRLYLAISIDGKEVPLEVLAFESLQLHSSRLFHCPIGNLSIVDNQNYFEKFPVGDGVKFEIYAGNTKDRAQAKIYKFRHFKTDERRVGGNTNTYDFRLIYDCPRFMNESTTNFINGNSTDVIQAIGKQVPFNKVVADPSSDSMPWLPFGKKRCEFVRHIVSHAYANDSSCFMFGITLNGVMNFRNVSSIDLTKAKNLLVKGSSKLGNSIKILAEKEVVNSGLLNAQSGYKMATLEQGTDSETAYTKVRVPTTSKQILVNQNISKGIESAKFINTPIRSSNTHPNFFLAEHQNTRIKNTYALNTMVVTDQMTDIDLFDSVTYLSMNQAQGKLQPNPKISGAYLVFAKTIFITNKGVYYEKFQLARQGYNLDVVSPSQLKAVIT